MGSRDLSKRPWLIAGIVVLVSILALVALIVGYFVVNEELAGSKSRHIEKVARAETSRIEPEAAYRSQVDGFIDCPSKATDNWFGGSSACIGGMGRTFGFTGDKQDAQQRLVDALKENGWASDRSNPPHSLQSVIKVASGDTYVVRWELYTREEVRHEFTREDLRPEVRESWRRGYAEEKAAFDSDPDIRTVLSVHITWIGDDA